MATPIWARVLEVATKLHPADAEAWLRQQLKERGYEKNTVSNWKGGRDIPPRAWRDAAEIIGRSRDWVETGVDVPDRAGAPKELIGRAEWEALTERERGYLQHAVRQALQECEEIRANGDNVRVLPEHTKPGVRQTSYAKWTAKKNPGRRIGDKLPKPKAK